MCIPKQEKQGKSKYIFSLTSNAFKLKSYFGTDFSVIWHQPSKVTHANVERLCVVPSSYAQNYAKTKKIWPDYITYKI